ncbi:uncharacterized protein LOC123467557 [Daphnia magna]|uniref:uncharacterized protein LOC123467557 n=1 Tax=Daphnia magna TaxID=35525 RepID=UPI001E1BA656|nr:uncharacterized protein LOC123467557 [Daphnia magna]
MATENAKKVLTQVLTEEEFTIAIRKRTSARMKITAACNATEKAIQEKGSKGAIQGLLKRLDQLLADADELNNNFDGLLEDTEAERQEGIHLSYVERIGTTTDKATQYFATLSDEATSVHTARSSIGVTSVTSSEAARRQTARRAADTARQAAEAAQEAAERAQLQAEEARAAALAAEEELQLYEIEDINLDDPVPDPVQQWLRSQRKQNTSPAPPNPDDWIDQYAAGKLKPFRGAGNRSNSSVRAELEPFSGKALDWFCWIDLFKALVHETTKSTGEKLALLKRHLKGDCLDFVHGLGGGEEAYIEALVRLKPSCGRRDVMRAAHIQAIEKLECKPDPNLFRRYAEKIRTHLFDLNRIGETSSTDIIERICLKLQPLDRLAWNAEGRGGMEKRSLHTFGTWLCDRAAAYQNAYSLATEQLTGAAPKATFPRLNARVNQIYSKGKEGVFKKGSSRPFCFKCKGEHKLEKCESFLALEAYERFRFCMRHLLCYGCFGPKHSARNCSQTKPCEEDGCGIPHPPLLHDRSRATKTTRTAVARTMDQASADIAMGMLRLEVLDRKGRPISANVFIDEGSNSSLMRQGFARAFKLEGKPQVLAVEGAGGVISHYQSQELSIQIRTTSGQPDPSYRLASFDTHWPHLSDIPVTKNGGRVDLLIGLDYGQLTAAIESRIGERNEPVAKRTVLGWIIRGVMGGIPKPDVVRSHTIFSSVLLEDLVREMKRFCDTENFVTEFQSPGMSEEDQRAISTLTDQTRKLEVGYEVPITWRKNEPDLTCNRQMAEDRFRNLTKRFERDPAFEKDYRAAMKKTLDKGPKLRVVFDAAASYKGKCLNDAIISGPALQPSLPAVLINFREGEVAWSSDVEAMFSRFCLKPSDANFFCFFWQEPASTDTIVCRMDRLPFGATCSPFVAIQTTRRAATEANAPTEIVDAIKKKMYVNDYLGSAPTAAIGLQEAIAVKDVLASADLHLQGWRSNSKEFIEEIRKNMKPANSPTPSLISEEENGKVLGVLWNSKTDTLGFRVSELENLEYTRMTIASKVASAFDPLGTAAPLIVKAKLSEFSFSRCLFPNESLIEESQLHAFGDASEEAYAAVIFLRHQYRDGQVRIYQLKASTKLAPKKAISMQKLELNAALLSARLINFVPSCLSRPISKKFLWTDSSTVRNWIRATASFYQVYVANRVGEIQMLTEPEEWRFVPGKLNPSGEATRSTLGEEILSARWMNGPEFLLHSEVDWPKDLPWMTVADEMSACKTYQMKIFGVYDWSDLPIDKTNFSSFLKLDDKARSLLKRCQQEVYGEEIQLLEKGKPLHKSSPILSLHPTLGDDGLLRLGGRIGRAKLPYDVLHPPLLPGRHPLTERIIHIFHDETHYAGTDYLFSQISQHFWIVKGREVVKKIRRLCPVCIRGRAAPAGQLMGDLPYVRLDSYTPPFSHIAIDYFGPIETSPGRNRITKRYGALITCLVTRGVHLELAESLSTDDFILVFRRFIGLYGRPISVHSDNGTNFVGAERELNTLIKNLKENEEIRRFIKEKGIDWRFQPPRTPHFGGAHESLVRSTKKALYRALEIERGGLRFPTDEMLRTLLSEVIGLLNTRPLTFASLNPEDFRPLTPNDFLNRPSTLYSPPGNFSDALPRERFRYTQRMAQLFWDLWTKIYLPSLVERKKWKEEKPNLNIGDVLMMIDSNLPRGQWRIGNIVKTYPGDDGLVRVVQIQTESGTYDRGIHRVCLLKKATATPPETNLTRNPTPHQMKTQNCLYLRSYAFPINSSG